MKRYYVKPKSWHSIVKDIIKKSLISGKASDELDGITLTCTKLDSQRFQLSSSKNDKTYTAAYGYFDSIVGALWEMKVVNLYSDDTVTEGY